MLSGDHLILCICFRMQGLGVCRMLTGMENAVENPGEDLGRLLGE